MAHLHPVYDTDPHFSIDSTSRGITYESTERLVIVQGDHNSQRYTFELPRYIDGHDMMLCDLVQVHYINIESGGRGRSTGVYKVTDMQLATDDDQVVVLSWLLSQNATKYVGSLNFVIRFVCTSGSKIDYAWSTTVYSAVAIITSIDNAELVVEQYADVLEQWYMELLMAGSSSADTVYAARDQAVEDVGDAKDAAIAEVNSTKDAAVSSVNSAKDAAVTAVGAAKTTAIDGVQADVAAKTDEYFNSLQNGAYKIIEQKASKKVDFWFGPQAEYNAIPAAQRATDRVYIPTDDTTLDDLNALIQDVDDIKTGNQVVGQATNATNADHATNAGSATEAENANYASNANHATSADSATNATNANHATSADSATSATNADYASSAGKATHISEGNIVYKWESGTQLTSVSIIETGLYLVTFDYGDSASRATAVLDVKDLGITTHSHPIINFAVDSDSKYFVIHRYREAYYDGINKAIKVRRGYLTSVANGGANTGDDVNILEVRRIMKYDDITFTIDNVSYTAARGMTWYQYANSDRPAQAGITLTCAATTNTVKYNGSNSTTYVYLGSTMVKGGDTITSGTNYVTISG